MSLTCIILLVHIKLIGSNVLMNVFFSHFVSCLPFLLRNKFQMKSSEIYLMFAGNQGPERHLIRISCVFNLYRPDGIHV